MNKVKLSIVIVNWNTKTLIKQCLESIIKECHHYQNYHPTTLLGPRGAGKYHKQNTDGWEIIVIDNGSVDGSVEEINKLKVKNENDRTNFFIILNKENLGYGKANNQGIRSAKGEYVLLLNSDTIVKPGAIMNLIRYLDDNPKVSVVGPKLLNTDGTTQANCGKFPRLSIVFIMLFLERFFPGRPVRYGAEKLAPVEWLMGAAIMAKRTVFDRIGGLDEGIFMYMEEVDWFYRVRQNKMQTMVYPKAEIVHLGRGSSKTGKKDPILNIYRGLIYFYRKHYGYPALTVLKVMLKIKASIAYILGIITKNKYLIDTYAQAIKIN